MFQRWLGEKLQDAIISFNLKLEGGYGRYWCLLQAGLPIVRLNTGSKKSMLMMLEQNQLHDDLKLNPNVLSFEQTNILRCHARIRC